MLNHGELPSKPDLYEHALHNEDDACKIHRTTYANMHGACKLA